MQRRAFLKAFAAAGASYACIGNEVFAQAISPSPTTVQPPFLASAVTLSPDAHYLSLLNTQGKHTLKVRLPTRAHHVAAHPIQPQVAVVARRPGTYVQVFDYQTQTEIADIRANNQRHFFGHGIYSPDGQRLYVTENNLENDQSYLAVYETVHYQRVATLPTQGIGAHELVWAGEGIIAVANGGILTRPEHGRKKLNLESMTPSLAYIDVNSGECIEQAFLPNHLHQLSIRHIAYSPLHGVVIGMQYQGEITDQVPLVALHQRGQPIQFMELASGQYLSFKQYCGSVRLDASGEYAAISSPVGGILSIWRLSDQQLVALRKAKDGCGVCATDNAREFIVTSGSGWVKRFSYPEFKGERLFKNQRYGHWDNHVISL